MTENKNGRQGFSACVGDWTSEPLQLIEDCTNREERLTDWDRTFLDSVFNQLAAKQPLSPKQAAKLDEIWERATARG